MTPWFQQWWTWISYTFFGDLEKTRVVDCRPSVMDETRVIDCRPTMRMRGMATAVTDRSKLAMRLEEKRSAVRYPCDREIRCAGAGADMIRGRARNVSAGGIGVVVGDRVEPGASVAVELSGRLLSAAVVHVRAMPIRGWYLGCSFAQPLTDAEVKELIGIGIRA